MVYDYECPKCGKTVTIEMKLSELKTTKVFCKGQKNGKHKECQMPIVLTWAHPLHSSWSKW